MMTMMSGAPKVCDTTQLLTAVVEAGRHNLNRRLHENTIAALDPDGAHVLTLVLWGHNLEHAPVLHHRVSCLLKVRDTMQPVCVLLDVTDEWWRRQRTLEAHTLALAEAEALEAARARDGF